MKFISDPLEQNTDFINLSNILSIEKVDKMLRFYTRPNEWFAWDYETTKEVNLVFHILKNRMDRGIDVTTEKLKRDIEAKQFKEEFGLN